GAVANLLEEVADLGNSFLFRKSTERAALDIVRGIAVDRLRARAPACDRSITIEIDDRFSCGLANRAQFRESECALLLPAAEASTEEAGCKGHGGADRKCERNASRTIDDDRDRPETGEDGNETQERAGEEPGEPADDQRQSGEELRRRVRGRREGKYDRSGERRAGDTEEPGLGKASSRHQKRFELGEPAILR